MHAILNLTLLHKKKKTFQLGKDVFQCQNTKERGEGIEFFYCRVTAWSPGLVSCKYTPQPPNIFAAYVENSLVLSKQKNFFPLRVTEPWNRLPREAVESPALEIFKTHLDKVLYSLL